MLIFKQTGNKARNESEEEAFGGGILELCPDVLVRGAVTAAATSKHVTDLKIGSIKSLFFNKFACGLFSGTTKSLISPM